MTQGELLKSGELAELLGVSKRTIHRMVLRGDLVVAEKVPGYNGAYLFRRSDIEAAA